MRDLAFERAVRFAAELVRIPSLPGRAGAAARRIVDEPFDEACTDRAGNVVARVAGTRGAPAVMLSSGDGGRMERLLQVPAVQRSAEDEPPFVEHAGHEPVNPRRFGGRPTGGLIHNECPQCLPRGTWCPAAAVAAGTSEPACAINE